MKRLFLLCAAAFAVVSCARDEALLPDSGTETVYSIEARLGQATRVALDGTKPEWTLEDTLAVYTGSGYSWHHFKPREGAPLGCFFGFQEPRSIPGATFNMATVGALNPMFDSKYGVDALWQTVPNVQAYVADSLAPKVFPMVGRWKASDKGVLFKPMAAMLVVPVYTPAQTGLRSVEVNAAGYPISGLFGLTTYKTLPEGYADPAVRENGDDYFINYQECTWVRVEGDIAAGTSASDAVEVRCVVLPTDFSKGFTVKVTDADGNSMTRLMNPSDEPMRLNPGQLQRTAPIEYVQKAPDYRVRTYTDLSEAQLKSGQTLAADVEYRWWLERDVTNDWGEVRRTIVTEQKLFTSKDGKYIDLTKPLFLPYLKPEDGERIYFMVSATESNGATCTRCVAYDYIAQPAEYEEDAFALKANIEDGWLRVTIIDPDNKFVYNANGISTCMLFGLNDNWEFPDYAAGGGLTENETWDAQNKVWSVRLAGLSNPPMRGMTLKIACGVDNDGVPTAVSSYVQITENGAEILPVAFKAAVLSFDPNTLRLQFSELPSDFPADPLTGLYLHVPSFDEGWNKPGTDKLLTPGELSGTWDPITHELTLSVVSMQKTWGVGIRNGGTIEFGYDPDASNTPQRLSNPVSFTAM